VFLLDCKRAAFEIDPLQSEAPASECIDCIAVGVVMDTLHCQTEFKLENNRRLQETGPYIM
jgi:hypothetical protein